MACRWSFLADGEAAFVASISSNRFPGSFVSLVASTSIHHQPYHQLDSCGVLHSLSLTLTYKTSSVHSFVFITLSFLSRGYGTCFLLLGQYSFRWTSGFYGKGGPASVTNYLRSFTIHSTTKLSPIQLERKRPVLVTTAYFGNPVFILHT